MPGKGAGLGCWVTRCLLLIAGAAFMATGDDRLSRIRGYLATARFTLTAREWRGVLSQYRFRCENGHASSQSGASLLRLVRGARGLLRCSQCWVKQMMTRIHETAGSAGGQCLSKRYCGKARTTASSVLQAISLSPQPPRSWPIIGVQSAQPNDEPSVVDMVIPPFSTGFRSRN